MKLAGFRGIFIAGYLTSPTPANQGCKPLSGEINVQNIPHGPVYPAGFAGYIALEVIVKLHGYADQGFASEAVVPSELAEVTLVATPDELRRIATFLEACASGMERRGRSWEHEHLSDKDRSFETSPHFIVFNPEYDK